MFINYADMLYRPYVEDRICYVDKNGSKDRYKCPKQRPKYPTGPQFITCHCGYVSSIEIGKPLLLYIPPKGIPCPSCGCILIHGSPAVLC